MSFFVIFNPIFQRLAVRWAYLQSFTAEHSTSCYIVYTMYYKSENYQGECARDFSPFSEGGLSFLISWTTSF